MATTNKRKYNAKEGLSAAMNQTEVVNAESLRVTTEFGQVEAYDNIEFTFNSGESDYSVKVNQLEAFHNVPDPKTVSIRTNRVISVKIVTIALDGSTTEGQSITIAPVDSPFEASFWGIDDILLTNSGADNASVKILLT